MAESVIGPGPANPYDVMPYAVYTFAGTHPDRLATVAMMCGMKPAAVEKCRVLELGCAQGGNLIPMAEALKGSAFVGIDYSARQIEQGNAIVSELGMGNIQLLHRDLLDVGEELGKFDYIIAHGVYSWVPDKVRDKLLAICRENLAEHGVAYVSYNTFPGWGLRTMIRDMMRYHIRNIDDPKEQVAQARGLLNFLSQSVPDDKSHYAGLLKDEVELIRGVSDAYLFHDHLEEVNQPCYFHEFVEHAGRHELQFLAEADPRSALGRDLKPEAREKVRPLGGTVEREQYLDFLRNRGFRQSLLCHKKVELQRKYDPNLLRGLYVGSTIRPVPGTDSSAPGPWKFVDSKGNELSTGNAGARDILMALAGAHPARIGFEELVRRVEAGPEVALSTAAELLFELYLRSIVEFFPRQIDFATSAGERPVVRALARLQAQKTERASSFLHGAVVLSPTARRLLPLLDGTRGRGELVEEFEKLLLSGQVADAEHLRALPAEKRREELGRHIEAALQKCVAAALIEV
jgi:methyltransferase-like protein/SAM-dependent methyltransferase